MMKPRYLTIYRNDYKSPEEEMAGEAQRHEGARLLLEALECEDVKDAYQLLLKADAAQPDPWLRCMYCMAFVEYCYDSAVISMSLFMDTMEFCHRSGPADLFTRNLGMALESWRKDTDFLVQHACPRRLLELAMAGCIDSQARSEFFVRILHYLSQNGWSHLHGNPELRGRLHRLLFEVTNAHWLIFGDASDWVIGDESIRILELLVRTIEDKLPLTESESDRTTYSELKNLALRAIELIARHKPGSSHPVD